MIKYNRMFNQVFWLTVDNERNVVDYGLLGCDASIDLMFNGDD